MKNPTDPPVVCSMALWPADRVIAVAGANHGDILGAPGALALDDAYRLRPAATTVDARLVLCEGGVRALARVQDGRHTQSVVAIEALLTFLDPTARTLDALLLAETETADPQRWLWPLGQVHPHAEFSLIAIDREAGERRLSALSRASFARGTRITLATGHMVPVETLRPGDEVLTRDSGAQTLRWTGQRTERAEGPSAPVHIAAGALNNAHDLLVAPDHRLVIYQRHDRTGAGLAEVTVRAGDLINGTTVTPAEGGFIEYFQLLFDGSETIYAEAIACESLRPGPAFPPALPAGIEELMATSRRRGRQTGLLIAPAGDERPDPAAELKRASLG